MTKQHSITPPDHLLDHWYEQYQHGGISFSALLIAAAKYGADMELEECCKAFESNSVCGTKYQRRRSVEDLRNKRRPKIRQATLTVSITGTDNEVEEFISKLVHDKKISIQL